MMMIFRLPESTSHRAKRRRVGLRPTITTEMISGNLKAKITPLAFGGLETHPTNCCIFATKYDFLTLFLENNDEAN